MALAKNLPNPAIQWRCVVQRRIQPPVCVHVKMTRILCSNDKCSNALMTSGCQDNHTTKGQDSPFTNVCIFFHPLFLLDPCKKSIDIFLSCISWNVLAFKVIMWHFFVVFAGKQRNSHNRATLTFKMKSASLASQIFEFATTSFYGIHTYWSSLKGSQAPSAFLY